mgnify:FL=1
MTDWTQPAFLIDPKTYTMIAFGSFEEMVAKLIVFIFMGCVVVEAPKDDTVLLKLLRSETYFSEYYKNYFEEYNKSLQNR